MSRSAVTSTLLAIFAVGVVLRVWATVGTDFWFDEIWSQELGARITLRQIFFDETHDTNHILNTVWCSIVGEQKGWFLYRIPALVCGSLSIVLLGLIAARHSAAAGVFTALIAAPSYLLVHYSSEARGYGPAVLLGLLAFWITGRFLSKPGWGTAAAYWLCCILGLLFHYTFFFAALGCGVWTVWRLFEEKRSWGIVLRSSAQLHAVPALTVGAIYFAIIRGMTIGGGPKFKALDVLGDLLVSTFAGGMGNTLLNTVVTVAGLGILVTECTLLWREKHAARVFYPALLILTPLVTFGILNPKLIYVRYFLIAVPFLILLFGSFLARCWGWGLAGRIAAGTLAGLCVIGNVSHVSGLLGAGRGQYLETMQYLAENTKSPDIRIALDMGENADPSLSSKVLAWYARFLPPGRTLIFDIHPEIQQYITQVSYQALIAGPNKLQMTRGATADWFIVYSWDQAFEPPPEIRIQVGRTFEFDRKFPFDSIAGWNWFLYRHRAR